MKPDERDPWELARPFFDVTPLDGSVSRGAMSKRGPLIVSNVSFGATFFDHDPASLHEFDNEYLLFERYRCGTNQGLVDDTPSRLDAHSMHVVDMSRRYRTATTHVSGFGVVIPHRAIGFDPGRDPAYVRLLAASRSGKVLDAALNALVDQNDLAEDSDEVIALADAFAHLVRRLMLRLSDSQPPEQFDRGNRGILRSHIDRHLSDAELGTEQLCNEFGVSRATLYRLFKDHGGVRRYIVDRRLDRCFADLMSGPPRRGRVREVAERWGFFDGSQFFRSFRARFDMAPSDCLDLPHGRGPRQSLRVGAHPVDVWMRHL